MFCFLLLPVLGAVCGPLLQTPGAAGLAVGAVMYFTVSILVVLYVVAIEKKPLDFIGLSDFSFFDIFKGLMMGLIMFVIQLIALFLVKADFSLISETFNWKEIVTGSIYCFLCVGVAEELVFRGFILQKSPELLQVKALVIGLNVLLFYMVHWPPIRFVFGEFFSIAINTIILCTYLYFSKRKSLLPLIIAHGFYDVLSSYLFPILLSHML